MIQTILLTVLFTLLGVGVVILLIWLAATSCKTKKRSKENSESIENLCQNQSLENDSLLKIVDGKYEDSIRRIDNVNTYFEDRLKDVNTEMNRRFTEVFRTMDSRFDKTLSKFNNQVENPYNVNVASYRPETTSCCENGGDKSWNLTTEE